MDEQQSSETNVSPAKASICISNLSYSIVLNGKVKRILRKLSLYLCDGDMCAVLGPSGAGKSTLLDLVGIRKTEGVWSGSIVIDGSHVLSTVRSLKIAYVYQNDLLISNLTVEETVKYATLLKLGSQVSDLVKQERVQAVIQQLGLSKVMHSRVFDSVKQCGLSGGEKKRLSIAIQIVGDPKFALLDEPTSGLDSALALEVITAVRSFCNKDRIVLATIHHPSRAVFALFDKVIVLVQGRIVFFGPSFDAVAYFASPPLGYVMDQAYTNPSEFILDICCGQIAPHGGSSAEHLSPAELSSRYESSKCASHVAEIVQSELYCGKLSQAAVPSALEEDEGSRSSSISNISSHIKTALTNASSMRWEDKSTNQFARSVRSQCLILLHRSWTDRFRDTSDWHSQLIKSLSFSLVVGLIYFKKGDADSPYYEEGYTTSSVQSLNSLLLQFVIYAAFSNISAIGLISSGTQLYRREASEYSVSPFAHAFSQAFSLLPIQLFSVTVVVFVVYFFSQLPAQGDYFFFLTLTTFMGIYCAFSFAMAVATNVADIGIVYTFVPAATEICISLSGYSPSVSDLPSFYNKLSFINFARWMFEAEMVNHWERYDTDDGSGYDENGNGDVLEDHGFGNVSRFGCLWILLLLTLVMLWVFYVGLLPSRSRLYKVSDAENACMVLEHVATKKSSFSKTTEKVFNWIVASNAADNHSSALWPSETLRKKLLHERDESSLIVEDPGQVDIAPRLSVVDYSHATAEELRGSGCCLLFKNVYSPPLPQMEENINPIVVKANYPQASEPSGKKVSGKFFVQAVNAVVMPGEMCAIMGPSGAGKTSLLNILAQRKNSADYCGNFFYNGVLGKLSPHGYVTQEDVHIPELTVRETLLIASELRLPESMSKSEKNKRVEYILDMLLLSSVSDDVVGGPFSPGISGGEMKRLSIGVELLHFPDLMFLDEPTTGLDSSTSLEIISALRNLANQNRTLILTIHQPSQDIFCLFDKILLLADSRVLYFGGTVDCCEFFTNSPYQFECPDTIDPAEFIISVASSSIPAADGRIITSGELSVLYTASQQCATVANKINSLEESYSAQSTATDRNSRSGISEGDNSWDSHHNLSLKHQLSVLLHRRILVIQRTWKMQIWKIIKEIIAAIIIGTIWLQIGSGTAEHVYTDRFSVLNKSLIYMTVRNLNPMAVFEDRFIYYRERKLNAYSPFAYWMSTWLLQIPLSVANGIIYGAVVYPLAGLRAGGQYVMTYQYFIITGEIAIYFLFNMVTALCPSPFAALHYLPLIQLTLVNMSGFCEYIPNMQAWVKVFTYGAVSRYMFQGLVLNELQDNGNLPESHNYIVELGFTGISVGGCAAMMLLFMALPMVGHYLAIKYIIHERR